MRLLIMLLLAMCGAMAQTTVQCVQPVSFSCSQVMKITPVDSTTSSVECPAQFTLVGCVVQSVSSQPTVSPIVDVATCSVDYGSKCNLHLSKAPVVGQHVILMGTSLYTGGGLKLPAGFQIDVNATNMADKIAGSKYIASAADVTQDFVITSNPGEYIKGAAILVSDIAAANWYDVTSGIVDNRTSATYTVTVNPTNSPDRLFVITHGWSTTPPADSSWQVVATIPDAMYKDVVLVQTKRTTAAGAVTATGSVSFVNSFLSLGIAYKAK